MNARTSNEPKGYRDVYWCYALNEPCILEYRDDKPFCVCCDGDVFTDGKDRTHTFIVHLHKPPYAS